MASDDLERLRALESEVLAALSGPIPLEALPDALRLVQLAEAMERDVTLHPECVLYHWNVVLLCDGALRLAGSLYTDDVAVARLSSPIMAFDAATLTASTLSRRVYRLIGPPRSLRMPGGAVSLCRIVPPWLRQAMAGSMTDPHARFLDPLDQGGEGGDALGHGYVAGDSCQTPWGIAALVGEYWEGSRTG